jgi:hypothetical protein
MENNNHIFKINEIYVYTFDNTKVIVTYVLNKHPRIEVSRDLIRKMNPFYIYPEQLIKI